MRIRFVAVLICALGAMPIPASAQPETLQASPESGLTGWILEHISIRQSLKDRNFINKAAILELSMPDEGDATRVVAAAASYDLIPRSKNPKANVGLSVQFNENTSQTARQNKLFAGTEAGWLNNLDTGATPRFTRLVAAAGYSRDGVKQTKAFAAKAYLSVEQLRQKDDPYGGLPLGPYIEYLPRVGVEFDHAFAAAHPHEEGALARTMASIGANLYPLPAVGTGTQIILSAEISYRRDVRTRFDGSDRDHPFGVFGVAVALDSSQRFLVALERAEGEDPDAGFAAQALWRLALKMQLAGPQKRALLLRRASERLRLQRGTAPVLQHPR